MHPIDQQLAKFDQMTVLCVGDLMLDRDEKSGGYIVRLARADDDLAG